MGVPGPVEAPLQCRIVRTHVGILSTYVTYSLYVEGPAGTFLMAARKRRKSKSSHYLISLDAHDMVRQSASYCGKLRGNFLGTEFTMLDTEANPSSTSAPQGESVPVDCCHTNYCSPKLPSADRHVCTCCVPHDLPLHGEMLGSCHNLGAWIQYSSLDIV